MLKPSPPPIPRKPATLSDGMAFDRQLRKFVLASRKSGSSWRSVEAELALAGVAMSHETLRRRFSPKSAPTSRPSAAPLTVGSICLALEDLLAGRIAAGCSWQQIESELRGAGVNIPSSSVRPYLSKARRRRDGKGG